MSDALYQTYQHYGTNAQRLAFTPDPPPNSPAGAIQPIYIWYETDTGSTFVYDTSWHALGGGGTGTVTHTAGALTLGQLVYGNGAADLKVVAATNGQIPIGKTSDGTAAFATITAGSGITVTNAANSITIASSASAAFAHTFLLMGA